MVEITERNLISEKISNIKVIPLNMETLNKEIDTFIKAKLGNREETCTYRPNEKFGVIKTEKKTILITNECYGNIINDDKFSVNVYKFMPDSIPLFPVTILRSSITEAIDEHGQTPISLEEFMGERFCYNSRIRYNINEIIDELNKN